MFTSPFTRETSEQEALRLAQSPEGSKAHHLSRLPEITAFIERGQIFDLSEIHDNNHRVVVVTSEDRTEPAVRLPDPEGLRQRHRGVWNCIVIASDHPSYPVGGYDLAIPATELARAQRIEI